MTPIEKELLREVFQQAREVGFYKGLLEAFMVQSIDLLHQELPTEVCNRIQLESYYKIQQSMEKFNAG